MDEKKLVEAVRKFDCLWKVFAKVYSDARAKENAWKAPCCVRKVNMDRIHTLLNPVLLFCLLRSASSSSSSSSSSVPFAINARGGDGGTSREYRVLWIDVPVRRSVRKDVIIIVNSTSLVSALHNATLGCQAGSSVLGAHAHSEGYSSCRVCMCVCVCVCVCDHS